MDKTKFREPNIELKTVDKAMQRAKDWGGRSLSFEEVARVQAAIARSLVKGPRKRH